MIWFFLHTLSLKAGVSGAFHNLYDQREHKASGAVRKKKSSTAKPHKAAKPLKAAETQIITNKDAHIIHKTDHGREHDLFKDKHPISQS